MKGAIFVLLFQFLIYPSSGLKFLDSIQKTALGDGCFWVSSTASHLYNLELPVDGFVLTKYDWNQKLQLNQISVTLAKCESTYSNFRTLFVHEESQTVMVVKDCGVAIHLYFINAQDLSISKNEIISVISPASSWVQTSQGWLVGALRPGIPNAASPSPFELHLYQNGTLFSKNKWQLLDRQSLTSPFYESNGNLFMTYYKHPHLKVDTVSLDSILKKDDQIKFDADILASPPMIPSYVFTFFSNKVNVTAIKLAVSFSLNVSAGTRFIEKTFDASLYSMAVADDYSIFLQMQSLRSDTSLIEEYLLHLSPGLNVISKTLVGASNATSLFAYSPTFLQAQKSTVFVDICSTNYPNGLLNNDKISAYRFDLQDFNQEIEQVFYPASPQGGDDTHLSTILIAISTSIAFVILCISAFIFYNSYYRSHAYSVRKEKSKDSANHTQDTSISVTLQCPSEMNNPSSNNGQTKGPQINVESDDVSTATIQRAKTVTRSGTATTGVLRPVKSMTIGSSAMKTFTPITHTSVMHTKELSIPAYLEINFEKSFEHVNQLFQSENTIVFLAKILDQDLLTRTGLTICVLKYSRKLRELNYLQEVALLSYFKDHPYFVRIIGYTRANMGMALKYYNLGDLNGWIHSKNSTSIPEYSSKQVFEFAADIATGLMYMHQSGFIHTDLKPLNILLDECEIQPGQIGYRAIINDLGSAHIVDPKSLLVQAFSPANIKEATIAYAPPEIIRLMMQQTEKWDLKADSAKAIDSYSYGVLLYEMMSRIRPYYQYPDKLEKAYMILKGIQPQFTEKRLTEISNNFYLYVVYQVMEACWQVQPEMRLSMYETVTYFESYRQTEQETQIFVLNGNQTTEPFNENSTTAK